MNRHIRSVADKFAAEGFLAVAPAIFDRIEKNVELGYEGADMAKAMELMQKLKIDDAVKDVDAALAYAQKATGKPVGVVGFCYGGTLAWLSATRLKPAAVVGYYGGQIREIRRRESSCPGAAAFREAGRTYSGSGCRQSTGGPPGRESLLV